MECLIVGFTLAQILALDLFGLGANSEMANRVSVPGRHIKGFGNVIVVEFAIAAHEVMDDRQVGALGFEDVVLHLVEGGDLI